MCEDNRRHQARGAHRFVALTAPKEWFGHLRFALRYEPLDAGVWNAVVHALEPNEMERWMREDPTGRFTRRAWYLYEASTGEDWA